MSDEIKDNYKNIEVKVLGDRGFKGAVFKDMHGVECSIQESSACAIENDGEGWRLWLGVDNPEIKVFRPDDGGWKDVPIPGDALLKGRMHLSQRQVRELLPQLQYFAETGSLAEPEELDKFVKHIEPTKEIIKGFFKEFL